MRRTCKLPGILGHLDVRLNVLGHAAVSQMSELMLTSMTLTSQMEYLKVQELKV